MAISAFHCKKSWRVVGIYRGSTRAWHASHLLIYQSYPFSLSLSFFFSFFSFFLSFLFSRGRAVDELCNPAVRSTLPYCKVRGRGRHSLMFNMYFNHSVLYSSTAQYHNRLLLVSPLNRHNTGIASHSRFFFFLFSFFPFPQHGRVLFLYQCRYSPRCAPLI